MAGRLEKAPTVDIRGSSSSRPFRKSRPGLYPMSVHTGDIYIYEHHKSLDPVVSAKKLLYFLYHCIVLYTCKKETDTHMHQRSKFDCKKLDDTDQGKE